MDISGIQKIWGGLEGQIRVIYPAIDEVLLDNLMRCIAEEEHLSEAEEQAIRKSINLLMRNESYYLAGDIHAKDAILRVLYTLYSFDVVEQSPDLHFTADIKDANLILIGGPVGNRMTQEVWERLKSDGNINSEFGENGLISYKSAEVEYKKGYEKGNPLFDHGFAIKKPSPFRDDRAIFIVAGWGAFGTQAAAAATVTGELANEIVARCGAESFEVIAKMQALDGLSLLQNSLDSHVSIIEPFKTKSYPNSYALAFTLAELQVENRSKAATRMNKGDAEAFANYPVTLTEQLARNGDKALREYYTKTEKREIDLNTEEGKQVWQQILRFYEKDSEKTDSIYRRLAKYSISRFRKAIVDFIYDSVFGVCGGITGDPLAGYDAAETVETYLLRKDVKKVKESIDLDKSNAKSNAVGI
jgi:hypothetical protein